MSGAAAIKAPSRLGWRVAAALGLAFALFAVFQNCDWLATFMGFGTHGDFGFSAVPLADGQRGSVRVVAVRPGTSAAKAGIAPGDHLLQSRPNGGRVPQVGDRLQVKIERPDGMRDATLVATPGKGLVQPNSPWIMAITVAADMPAVLLGFFVLVRGRSRPAPVLLGVSLLGFGLAVLVPSPSFSGPSIYLPVWVVNTLSEAPLYIGFPAFGLSLLAEAAGRTSRWLQALLAAYAVVFLFSLSQFFLVRLGMDGLIGKLLAVQLFGIMGIVSLGGTFAALLAGWALSRAAEKRRFALLLAATACVLVNQAYNDLYEYVLGVYDAAQWQALTVNILAGVVAPILFAYAILKHRVLDLGFALNRTLVYSVVSAILLGAFGLIEWAVDQVAKVQGREQSALIDAAIALGVFLTFHRVRDWVEKAIEALFFRRWQEKEAQLRRFVADAAFVTRHDSLLKGFAAALARFADGAPSALYLKAEEGGFVRAAGDLPGAARALDADDSALVRLRAERTPVEPAQLGSTLPAELACPMVHRGEVIGVALLAGREPGVAFRPDEEALLGWATLQVGLDLHALEVEQLQAQVTRLEHQLEGARLATAGAA